MDAYQTNMDVPFCGGCVRRDQRIAQLEKRIGQLEKRLEELSRAGKRQAAPFSRGLPRLDPKKPGRKSGEDYGTKAFRAIPPMIDEVHDAPLPPRCPRCGKNTFIDERIEHQYQVEIPRRPIRRQFNVAVARCACCDQRVQGRHPLQTSDALGCCASQIGPEAQAAVVTLNKELGLSQGKISRFFQMLFGIKLTRGGSCQIMLRAADRCEGHYHAIVKRVQRSPWIVPDETGWRIGGWGAWMHAAVGRDAVAYLIARQRGFEASAMLIGEDYAGKLIHDGFASYDRFQCATHQTCLAHLLRRCHALLETATRGAVIFPRKVRALLQESLERRDQGDAAEASPSAGNIVARRLGDEETSDAAEASPSAGNIVAQTAVMATVADDLQSRMMKLVMPVKTHAGNERLCRHLLRHADQLFTFLRHPGIDATNWRAEQAIRPAVVNRKVWGGNRTEAGASAQAILMTVLFTAIRNSQDVLELVSRTLRTPPNHPPLLSPDTG